MNIKELNTKVTTKFELLTIDEMEEIIVKTYEAQEAGKIKQRKQKPAIINRYVRDILNGDWEPNPQPLVITDKGYAIDGMHRMLAAVESKTPVVFNVTRNWPSIETFKVLDTGTPRNVSALMRMDGLTYATKRSAMLRAVAVIAVRNNYRACVRGLSIAEITRIYNTVAKSFETILNFAAEHSEVNKHMGELYGALIYAHTVMPNITMQFADSYFKMDLASGTGTWALKRWMDRQGASRGFQEGTVIKVAANAIMAWKNKTKIESLRDSTEAFEWLSDGNPTLQKQIRSILGVK